MGSDGRLKICCIHHFCPTAAEPYRGAPIWRTLDALKESAELTVCCSLPKYPAVVREDEDLVRLLAEPYDALEPILWAAIPTAVILWWALRRFIGA